MSKGKTLVPLLRVLRDLVAWLKAKRIQDLIIGGVAASILGRPRATRDVDALVLRDEQDWDGFLTAGLTLTLQKNWTRGTWVNRSETIRGEP